MQRILKISKYRNIGLEKPETLIINHSIKKGEIGNLIVLIGANNSGKSNIIDALKSIGDGQLSNRDITTLSFNAEDRIPAISFGIKDFDNSIYYNLVYGKQANCQFNVETKEIVLPSKDELLNDVNTALNFLDKYGMKHYLAETAEQVQRFEGKFTKEFVDQTISKIDEAERRFVAKYKNKSFVAAMPSDGYWSAKHVLSETAINAANLYCEKNYGIEFLPSIIYYKEVPLISNQLQSAPNKIQDNLFFHSLFKAIGVNLDEINNAYNQYQQFHNSATLNKVRKKLDSKIAILNEQFNKLYFAESDEYKFTISLGDSFVTFGMARGKDEDPIMLEYQSAGFKWFFNLFFNFLGSNSLKPGDIIIMDEPATNLHPKGQYELRNFIKRFARNNDLTFIIATHSPFLIDIDNFDELRVVSMENNRSKIDNFFTAVNYEDPDSLLPIKESLTIEQNVLYNLETEVVWVEGITDYNYLTMFKNLFGEKNIAFLPCNGIGNTAETQNKILKRLISIKFHKRNILVDGDKAGMKMKEACSNTVFKNIVCLSDLNQNGKKYEEIEDLFSEEDYKKYNLSKKSAGFSSLMKAFCKVDSFTNETISNFRSLFSLLKDRKKQ